VEEIACTAAGRALLDDATAAAQATTLGLGTGDGPTFDHLHITHNAGLNAYSVGYVAVNDAARTNTALTDDCIVAWTALTATRNYQISSEDIAVAGRVFIIKDESGSAGSYAITVSTEGSETIDGADTISINSNYGSVTLYSNGSNLFIV
jgi:hypothetical protein